MMRCVENILHAYARAAALGWWILLCFPPSLYAGSSESEQWLVEPFTQALSGGPNTGPVVEAGSSVHSLCADSQGNLYLAQNQRIDIVTTDGIRRHLAGTGDPGYRDGPAPQARFRLGFGAYYNAYNIACGSGGDVFVADSGNRRIRRVFEKDGRWFVATWAGGGTLRLRKGQSAGTSQVALGGTISVAVTPKGEVVVATNSGAFRVSPDDETITYLGAWPNSTARKPGRPPALNIMMGDADRHGNAYFVSRTPSVVVKVDPTGAITHLAGIVFPERKPDEIGDGPPREAYFNTPTSLATAPDGSNVYVCGGDEYDIRRVPTDGVSSTATLMQNGRWYRASVHPNKSRGAAVFLPDAQGRLRPDGKLTDLMASHLVGRDGAGNLYALIYRWTAMTQYVEGDGLLPTRVFRLRRVTEEEAP